MKAHTLQAAMNLSGDIQKLTKELASLTKTGKDDNSFSTAQDPTIADRVGNVNPKILKMVTLSQIYDLIQQDLVTQLKEKTAELEAL
jgi:hypothetical protein